MSWPNQDMYTVLERSVQQCLKEGMTANNLDFPIFSQQVSKKEFPDSHAAVSVIKVSDSPNFASTGGEHAYIDTPVLGENNKPKSFTRQPWGTPFDLLYQVTVEADNLNDVRTLENLVRMYLRPHSRLKLWDSDTKSWSDAWVNFHYAGYINRDQPENTLYNRVQNIRFETFSFPPTVNVPAITSIDLELEPTD